jgi:hypothetical protein
VGGLRETVVAPLAVNRSQLASRASSYRGGVVLSSKGGRAISLPVRAATGPIVSEDCEKGGEPMAKGKNMKKEKKKPKKAK